MRDLTDTLIDENQDLAYRFIAAQHSDCLWRSGDQFPACANFRTINPPPNMDANSRGNCYPDIHRDPHVYTGPGLYSHSIPNT